MKTDYDRKTAYHRFRRTNLIWRPPLPGRDSGVENRIRGFFNLLRKGERRNATRVVSQPPGSHLGHNHVVSAHCAEDDITYADN